MSPPPPTSVHLGAAIRRLRHVRRLSIDTLAGAAGMHPTYLSAIERGERNPSWGKVCDLARGLGTPVYALARAAEAEAHGAIFTPGVELPAMRAA